MIEDWHEPPHWAQKKGKTSRMKIERTKRIKRQSFRSSRSVLKWQLSCLRSDCRSCLCWPRQLRIGTDHLLGLGRSRTANILKDHEKALQLPFSLRHWSMCRDINKTFEPIKSWHLDWFSRKGRGKGIPIGMSSGFCLIQVASSCSLNKSFFRLSMLGGNFLSSNTKVCYSEVKNFFFQRALVSKRTIVSEE